jgi:hypothetical protein
MASLQFATSAFATYRTEPLPALDWQFEAALLSLQLASFTTTSAGPQEERSPEQPNAPRCFVVAVPQGIRLRNRHRDRDGCCRLARFRVFISQRSRSIKRRIR